jgi:hypothetical protein
MTIIFAIILGILGSVMNRWRGMDSSSLPFLFKSQQFRRVLCGLYIAIGAVIAGASLSLDNMWMDLILTILAITVLALPGIVIGHGSYFPGNTLQEDNEIFKYITRLIENPMGNLTKSFGMFLTGLLITMPIALLIDGVVWWWMFIAIAKPIGYYIGWKLTNKVPEWFPIETEFGEWWWGFFVTSSIVFAGI